MLTQQFETESCWDSQYWLRHCEGYRVFAGDEPIGYVEEVELGPDDVPQALVIRVGEVFTHLLTVGVDTVESLDPAGERVTIGTPAGRASDALVGQLRVTAAR
jgi:hypothetical protein